MWETVPCASAILISGVQSTLSLSRPLRGGLPDQKDLYLMVVQLDHFVMDLRRTENMTKSRGCIKVEHDDIKKKYTKESGSNCSDKHQFLPLLL